MVALVLLARPRVGVTVPWESAANVTPRGVVRTPMPTTARRRYGGRRSPEDDSKTWSTCLAV
jgi:hypothetical protein